MIQGDTTVPEGRMLELICLLSNGGDILYTPQWYKGSGGFPDHVIVL